MSLLNRISKLFTWLSLGWKDQDYDYKYFISILETKLNSMHTYFLHDGLNTIDRNTNIKALRLALKCLTHWQKTDWIDVYRVNTKMFRWKISKRGVLYNDEKGTFATDNELKRFNKFMWNATKFKKRMKKRYKKLFFRILYKHLENMWD